MPTINVTTTLKDIKKNLNATRNELFTEKIIQIICLLPELNEKQIIFFKNENQNANQELANNFFELFKKNIPSGSQRLHAANAANAANQQRKAIVEWVLENTGWQKTNRNEWSYTEPKEEPKQIQPKINSAILFTSIQDPSKKKEEPYFLVLYNLLLLINTKKTSCEKIANSEEFKQNLSENKGNAVPRRVKILNSESLKPSLSLEDNVNTSQLFSKNESIEKNEQTETTNASPATYLGKITIDEENKSLTAKSFTEEEKPDFLVNKSNSGTELSDLTQKLKSTITEINDKHKILATNIDKASHSLQKGIHKLNQMGKETQLLKNQFQESIDQDDKANITDSLEKEIDLLGLGVATTKEDKISLHCPDEENDDFTKLLEESNSAIRKTQEDTQRIKRLLDENFDSFDEKSKKEVNSLFDDENINQPLEKIITIQQDLQAIDEEIDQLDNDYYQQELKVEQLNKVLELSNQKITELKNKLQEVEKNERNISQQVEELKTELEEKNNGLQQALQAENQKFEKLNQAYQQQEETIKELEDQSTRIKEESNQKITELTNQLQKSEEAKENASQQIEELKNKFEEKNNDHQQALQAKDDEIEKLKTDDQQQKETIKELEDQSTRIKEESNQKITELTNQLQKSEEAKENASQQIEELKNKFEEKNNDLQQALQAKNDEIEKLKTDDQQQKETIKELEDQSTRIKEESNQKITELTNQLQKSEEAKENASQQIEELKNKFEEKNNGLQQALQAENQKFEKLNQAYQQQEETIKELEDQSTRIKEESNQKITELTNQLQEVEKNERNISQQVEELKTELEEKNNAHQQALQAKDDEIEKLKTDDQQQKETIKELNDQLTKNKEESNQKITELTNQLQEVEKNERNISQQVEELKTELEEKNNTPQQAFQAKDDEIEKLKADDQQQKETIKTLTTENDTLLQDLQDKNKENEKLKTDDQQQKETIKTLTTEKSTLQQDLQAKSVEIDRFKEKLGQQETSITTLENQLKHDQDNLNHKITKLNQEIESKNKIISDLKNQSKNKTEEKSVQTESLDLQSQPPTDILYFTDKYKADNKLEGLETMGKNTSSISDSPFIDQSDSDDESGNTSSTCIENEPSSGTIRQSNSSRNLSRNLSEPEESDTNSENESDSGIDSDYESNHTEERKSQPQFDYNHLKNFPSLAKIISSEINKGHCHDITELDTFNVSKKIKGVFFPNISDQKREEILTNEKNNLKQKFNERLAKLWKDYAKNPTITQDELQSLLSEFKIDIEQIQNESFNKLLNKTKEDTEGDFFKEYLKWIKPTQDRIISAGHYQTSPLLNQLKIKISPYHCTTAEEAENEFKKHGLHLKKEDPSVLGTSIGLSLSETELKNLILDKIEKRLPLEFSIKTFQLDSFAQKVCSTAVENGFGFAAHLLAIILIILVVTKNWESDEQKITNALVSVIKENQLAINPDEVKIELKLTDSDEKNTGKKDYTVFRPLSPIESKYQEQIKEANAKLKEEKKKPKLARKIIVEPGPEPEPSTSTSCKLN